MISKARWRHGVAVGHRLEDRVVLAVDREQGGAGLGDRAQHDLAEAQTRASLLAKATTLPRRMAASVDGEAGGAGNRGHRPVGVAFGGLDHRVRSGGAYNPGARQGIAQHRKGGGIGDDGALGVERDGLLRQEFGVAAGDQGADLEPSRRGTQQQVDRLGSHAAGAT